MGLFEIPTSGLRVENGGFFVSRGEGTHPRRTINSHELIVVCSGLLSIREGERLWQISAGETLILEPGIEHEGTARYPADLSFYWVHFHLPNGRKGTQSASIPKSAQLQRPERMAEMLHRFLDEQESGDFSPEEEATLLTLLLLETRRAVKPGLSNISKSIAGRAQVYIRTHCTQGIGTAQVARDLRLNPDYLGRVFRAATGVSLTHAIHQEQMREARGLLRESALNIGEVALAAGFRDASHFRRLFHRLNGLSPRDYRYLYARRHVNTT